MANRETVDLALRGLIEQLEMLRDPGEFRAAKAAGDGGRANMSELLLGSQPSAGGRTISRRVDVTGFEGAIDEPGSHASVNAGDGL